MAPGGSSKSNSTGSRSSSLTTNSTLKA
jgi:hypothetical protein